MLLSNIEEIFRLRNHNKKLITKIKKLKHSGKKEHSGEDLEGRTLEKLEENQCLKNRNQELENQIKKLEIEKKSQDERFRIITIYKRTKKCKSMKIHPKMKSRK